MKRKKLKKQIRKLNKRIKTLEYENYALRDDVGELCEDYNSVNSIGIRVKYVFEKSIDLVLNSGTAPTLRLKGIFFNGKITKELFD